MSDYYWKQRTLLEFGRLPEKETNYRRYVLMHTKNIYGRLYLSGVLVEKYKRVWRLLGFGLMLASPTGRDVHKGIYLVTSEDRGPCLLCSISEVECYAFNWEQPTFYVRYADDTKLYYQLSVSMTSEGLKFLGVRPPSVSLVENFVRCITEDVYKGLSFEGIDLESLTYIDYGMGLEFNIAAAYGVALSGTRSDIIYSLESTIN